VCSQCPTSCTCAAGPSGPTEAGGGGSGGGGQSCGAATVGTCQGCQISCAAGQDAVCMPGKNTPSGCTAGTCACEPGSGGSGSGGSSGSGGGSDGGMSGSSGGGSSGGSSSSGGTASSGG
jgi:hypothetical protein